MIYIASPYTHDNAAIKQHRYEVATYYANKLIRRGQLCFSPITYGHQFHVEFNTPETHEFWSRFNRYILLNCTQLCVLKLEGWQKSVGVTDEIEIADEHHIPIRYITSDEILSL